MNTKEQNLPVFVEDAAGNAFHAPAASEYSGELSVGPVSFKGSSKGSANGAVIGGVLAGGAVAIGAVAVVLTLLGAGRNG